MKFRGSSDVMVTCPSCETGTDEKLQLKAKVAKRGCSTCFPKSHGSGWSCFYLYINWKKKVYGFICVGKHSILYCAIHYYRKKHVSVGKVGALKIFLLLFNFPLQKILLPFLGEVNCARRIKFWVVFISCMLSSLLLIPLFNCSLCWMCESVKHSNSGYCLCWTM